MRVGCSVPSLSDWETGRRANPSARYHRRLMSILNVRLDLEQDDAPRVPAGEVGDSTSRIVKRLEVIQGLLVEIVEELRSRS
mgnify:FL=1